MADEKVHERVPVSQHRNAAAAADGKTHRERVQLDTGRERQRGQTGEDTEGWLGTQHQREREKFLNPHPCHTETKVGGRLCMVIFFFFWLEGGGVREEESKLTASEACQVSKVYQERVNGWTSLACSLIFSVTLGLALN